MTNRPQYHFTPDKGWMNDPNGLVYYEGEYHLFYQFNPDSNNWGPMHWGHAVSPDMLRWEHLPIALYPDELGYIFSGSIVIDWQNTSDLGRHGKPPMIAIFTHHSMEDEKADAFHYQYQSIAYSNDKGRTWTKYANNPVLPNPGMKDFRDPKVIWHSGSGMWVMVLASYDKVMIYNSPNLLDWTFTSQFGIEGDTRVWECPDLFPLIVEDSVKTKWVLLVSIQKEGPNSGSATGYFIGDFNGEIFEADVEKQQWADYGKDNYAMVSWSDIPDADGRRLALGWMSNWEYADNIPTENWRGMMTLPRELKLFKEGEEYHLRSLPIKELVSIEVETSRIDPQVVNSVKRIDIDAGNHLYKVDLTFADPGDGIVVVRLSNEGGEYIDVCYHGVDKLYYIDRMHAGDAKSNSAIAGVHSGPANYHREDIQMTIFLDVLSVELFADDSRIAMTEAFFPSMPFDRIEILGEPYPITLTQGRLSILSSSVS